MEITAEKPYTFYVTVVTDGGRYGLLFERKKAGEAKPQYGYFWLKEPEGLGPTPIIHDKCGDNCDGLERAEYHKEKPKKFARLYIQERIFREILNYAKAAGESGNIRTERLLTQDYTDDKRGYAQILHRFFYADPPYELAEFLDGLDIFTSYVLRKPEGKNCLVGMAEEFAVRSPYNLFQENNLDLLFTAEELLDTKHPPPAEWFRPGGPVISDFRDKRVYARKVIKVLKEKVLGNPVYLLEGDAATGKTVIARNLIYDLHEESHRNIYYFDIAPRRYFSETQLVREIKAVKDKSVIVVENIHLEPHKVQLTYQKIKHDPDRHILFTARPSYREFQDEFSLQKLTEVDTLTLEPFDEAKGIIDTFCSHPEIPDVVSKRRDEILGVAKNDYWLLAFALQGCSAKKGRGEPISWIRDEIIKYLRNLETCRDPHDDQYPGILLALSPLYKNEVLTAESYLTERLDFTKSALNDLTQRGEITKQRIPKVGFMYGLPHSSRADAYWEHGREYIKKELWEYDEFIYDYAISDVSNGLKAVMSTEKKTRKRVLAKLDAKKETMRVIEREQSTEAVYNWIEEAKFNIPIRKKLLEILAKKIYRNNDCFWAGCCIENIKKVSSDSAQKLCQMLTLDELLGKLSQTQNASDVISCVHSIFIANPQIGKRLLNLLRQKKVVVSLYPDDVYDVCRNIREIDTLTKDVVADLWKIIGFQELAEALFQKEDYYLVGCISDIFTSNRQAGQRLWRLMDRKKLANRLGLRKNLSESAGYIITITTANELAGKELCRLLNINRLGDRLSSNENIFNTGRFIVAVYNANKKKAKELCESLNYKKLAKHLNQAENIDISNTVVLILMICEASRKAWINLCRLMNMKALASKLKSMNDDFLITACIATIYMADKDAGCELYKFLGEE